MQADRVEFRPWMEAWQAALYGDDGFYRRAEGPAQHFTTASHGPLGPVLAATILAAAADLNCETIVDLGAGRGELLTALRTLTPDVPLIGVDVVERPNALAPSIAWRQSPGGALIPDLGLPDGGRALVVANEWLDVVACPIAEIDGSGTLREVQVDRAGRERLAGPVTGADLAWVERWWPLTDHEPGSRVEIGRARDDAWAAVLATPGVGAALAIDYGHLASLRPPRGSLVGYRDGTLTPPIPDGRHDLTAHVAVDSLPHTELVTQRAALDRWGPLAPVPPLALATTDPPGYLRALAASSALHALRQGGTGDFWWVIASGPATPA